MLAYLANVENFSWLILGLACLLALLHLAQEIMDRLRTWQKRRRQAGETAKFIETIVAKHGQKEAATAQSPFDLLSSAASELRRLRSAWALYLKRYRARRYAFGKINGFLKKNNVAIESVERKVLEQKLNRLIEEHFFEKALSNSLDNQRSLYKLILSEIEGFEA